LKTFPTTEHKTKLSLKPLQC